MSEGVSDETSGTTGAALGTIVAERQARVKAEAKIARLKADRRTLVERAVRAGTTMLQYQVNDANIALLAARVLAEHDKDEAGAAALRNALERALHACHEMHTREGDDAAGPIRDALASDAGAKAAKVLEAAVFETHEEGWDFGERGATDETIKEKMQRVHAAYNLRDAAVGEWLGRKP
jgi:hypothetical protein